MRAYREPVAEQERGALEGTLLRRDSVGADFQSVRKLTNYICATTSAGSDVDNSSW
jgi:hypothetical protein